MSMYYNSNNGTKTTTHTTNRTKNAKVMDDLGYATETKQYARRIFRYETKLKMGNNNCARGYALVLQHYPKEMQTELRK